MPYTHTHHHYHLTRMKEMGRIYWCHSVITFGISLVVLFIPIFLLKIGYGFQEVLVYILVQNLLSALLQYPVGQLFQYLAPHRILVLGATSYMVMFGLLISLPEHGWPLALIALFWAIHRTCYWGAFHYIFSAARAHKQAKHQIAGINALNMLAATAAPAVGGIAASLFGMEYVYGAAIVIIVIALLPVLAGDPGPSKTTLHLPRHFLITIRPDLKANVFNGMVIMAETNIWPLFIFLIVSSYAGIGALSAVIAGASILVTLYVGRTSNKLEKKDIGHGLTAYSLASLGRSVVQNSFQIFGLNFLGGIGRSLYVTPYMNRYYHNSDGPLRIGYITVMETAFELGAMLYIAGLLLLTLLFTTSSVLAIGLAFVAVAVYGVRLIR